MNINNKENIITLENITKSFTASEGVFSTGEQFFAVDNVSINIKEGSSLGIVGESGSGKTTIARMICNIYKPDNGRILYFGKDINSMAKNDYED